MSSSKKTKASAGAATSITLVVGLPGSGKTELARRDATARGLPLFDDLGVATSLDALITVLASGVSVIATDPNLCDPAARARATALLAKKVAGVTVMWIFFQNEPEQCLANVRRRNDGRNVEETIRSLSKVYRVPEGADVRPVWRPEKTAEDDSGLRGRLKEWVADQRRSSGFSGYYYSEAEQSYGDGRERGRDDVLDELEGMLSIDEKGEGT